MSFKQSIEDGYAKKIPRDELRARSLIKASQEAIATAEKIPKSSSTYKTIVRELYEGFRQYCEALGFLHGYKFSSHEVITFFLDDVLHEKRISLKFDRYRKLRNGINYYGDDVAPETVHEALKEIPQQVHLLSKHLTE